MEEVVFLESLQMSDWMLSRIAGVFLNEFQKCGKYDKEHNEHCIFQKVTFSESFNAFAMITFQPRIISFVECVVRHGTVGKSDKVGKELANLVTRRRSIIQKQYI